MKIKKLTDLPKRPLGNTGLSATEIGLGTGYIGAWRNTPHEVGIQVVKRAIELGVNYIDTAPFYGNAQEILGEALGSLPCNYYISTKCGRFTDDHNSYRSVDAFKRQFENTLHNLKRDRVDNINIHECDWRAYWDTSEYSENDTHISLNKEYDYEAAEVVIFLKWALEQKLTRFIGLSGNNADLVAKVLKEIPLKIDIVLIAYQYDLIWRNAVEDLIPVAREMGAGILLGGAYHFGRFTKRHDEWIDNPPPWMTKDLKERFRRIYSIQRECSLSLAELNTRFLLTDMNIDCIVPGTSNPARVDENVSYSLAGPLSDGLYEELKAVGTVVPDWRP